MTDRGSDFSRKVHGKEQNGKEERCSGKKIRPRRRRHDNSTLQMTSKKCCCVIDGGCSNISPSFLPPLLHAPPPPSAGHPFHRFNRRTHTIIHFWQCRRPTDRKRHYVQKRLYHSFVIIKSNCTPLPLVIFPHYSVCLTSTSICFGQPVLSELSRHTINVTQTTLKHF